MKTLSLIFGVGALVIALYVGLIAILSAILSWAWNSVVPSIFSGPTLPFEGAFAILVIIAVLRAIAGGGATVTTTR